MFAVRKCSHGKLVVVGIVLTAATAVAGASLADPVSSNAGRPDDSGSLLRMAQMHFEVAPPMPAPVMPAPILPPIATTPMLPAPTLPTPLPAPQIAPSLPAPSYNIPAAPGGGGGGPPPAAGIQSFHVVPACVITTAGGSPSGNCHYRYIGVDDLYQDLSSCSTGACFAQKFLDIDQAPLVVVYPAAPQALVAAQAQLHAEMAAGIRAMGAGLEQQVSNGTTGLPSLSEIDDLVDDALSEVDAIDQPVNESSDQRLRRLGLTPSIRSLANQAQ